MKLSDLPAPNLGLRRQLGLASATAAVAGESIAVGIFLTPAGMAKSLGSPLWMLFVWIAAGILAMTGALCYGELAARFPRDGGVYVYLLETCGRRIAFLYGWMCLLVLDPGLTAALAVGLASYAAYILPASAIGIKLVAISVIWALCILNVLSIRVSAGFLRWTTWLKLGLLAVLGDLGVRFSAGIMVELLPRSSRNARVPCLWALRWAQRWSARSSPSAAGGNVSKIAGEVRGSRAYPASRHDPGCVDRHRRLYRRERDVSLPHSAGESHFRPDFCRAGGSGIIRTRWRSYLCRDCRDLHS